jgi:hypothetical protein
MTFLFIQTLLMQIQIYNSLKCRLMNYDFDRVKINIWIKTNIEFFMQLSVKVSRICFAQNTF